MKFLRPLSCVAFAALAGCGPSITQPSTKNISGEWTSNDKIGPVSQFRINIVQQADGSVTGQWSAATGDPNAICPPNLGADPHGNIVGTHTILEIHFDIAGIGNFDGQLLDDGTMRGSVDSCQQIYLMRFTRS